MIDDLVTENAELQQQLQSSTQQLTRKEAELTRAEETIRREQQQMRQLVLIQIIMYIHVRDLPLPTEYEPGVCVLLLFFNVQEVIQQQLQSSEREKQMYRQQLTRKEAKLTRAEEIIRREQQQIQEMRQQVSLVHVTVTCSVCCD